jgi:hypothetical protein
MRVKKIKNYDAIMGSVTVSKWLWWWMMACCRSTPSLLTGDGILMAPLWHQENEAAPV